MKTICYRRMFISLLMCLGLLVFSQAFTQTAFAQENHHTPLLENNEKVLVSFAIEDSAKILTVATAEDDSYIIYRFGRENQVELEFPSTQEGSWDKFTHMQHLRDVGEDSLALEISYLEFRNYGYTYKVYDAYSAEFDKTFVGVLVVEHATGNEYDIQAIPGSKIGSLSRLNAHNLIEARAAF